MQRIPKLEETQASPETAKLLSTVKRQMGVVPNILGTMAQSSAALGGYLGLAGAVAGGKLSAKLREQIALAVAGSNGCDYCASVHTALGSSHGLAEEELQRNLHARSSDPKVETVLGFVSRIVAARGHVADEDVAALRREGFDDEQIVEIVANTALNIFTNYFNHVAETEIDFPVVRTAAVAAA